MNFRFGYCVVCKRTVRVVVATTLIGALGLPTWGHILHVPGGLYEAAHVQHIGGEPIAPPNFQSVQTVTNATGPSTLSSDSFTGPLDMG